MVADDEWTPVLPRRGARRRRKPPPRNLNAQTSVLEQDCLPLPWTPSPSTSPISIAALLQKIRRSIARLQASAFHRHFLCQIQHHPTLRPRLSSLLRSSPHLVVYGIGSIDAHEPPRLQLALALLLHKELNFTRPIEIFDPVLSASECRAMEELGCRVMEVDEKGKRVVESPTLFYMPHCEAVMYDGLLEANWKDEALEKMVVLGNSFREYESYVSGMGKGSRVDGEATFVVKATKIVEEVPIDRVEKKDEGGDVVVLKEEEGHGFFNAFNLTSWHFFCIGDKAKGLGIL